MDSNEGSLLTIQQAFSFITWPQPIGDIPAVFAYGLCLLILIKVFKRLVRLFHTLISALIITGMPGYAAYVYTKDYFFENQKFVVERPHDLLFYWYVTAAAFGALVVEWLLLGECYIYIFSGIFSFGMCLYWDDIFMHLQSLVVYISDESKAKYLEKMAQWDNSKR